MAGPAEVGQPYRVERGLDSGSEHADAPGAATPDAVTPHSSPNQDDTLLWRSSGLVLVVDDEPAVAKVTGMVLDQCGFSVDVASSGDDALRHIARYSKTLRLVLIDLTMPDKNGIEVMHAARSQGFTVPMILTSGYPKEEADKRFVSDGFSGYLQKPYRLETLIEVFRQALGE